MNSYRMIYEIVQEAAGPWRSEEVLEKILRQLESDQLNPEHIARIIMQFNTSTEHSSTMREQRILWQGMVKYAKPNLKAFNLVYHEDDRSTDRLNVTVQLWE